MVPLIFSLSWFVRVLPLLVVVDVVDVVSAAAAAAALPLVFEILSSFLVRNIWNREPNHRWNRILLPFRSQCRRHKHRKDLLQTTHDSRADGSLDKIVPLVLTVGIDGIKDCAAGWQWLFLSRRGSIQYQS